MKTKYIFLLLLFIVTAARSNELADKAQAAYEKQDYKTAIQAYEQLKQEGYVSDRLYYNLGNAYFKDQQLGKAIYNYELSLKLNPGDDDTKNNLRLANAKTVDKIEAKENFFVSAVKSGILTTFSTAGWAWITIGALVLGLLLLFFYVASRIVLQKRIFFFSGCLFLIVFVVTLFLGFAARNSKESVKFAVILSHDVKILNEPTPNAKSKFSLHEGTKVKVLQHESDWTSIKLENGNEGWVKTEDVGLF